MDKELDPHHQYPKFEGSIEEKPVDPYVFALIVRHQVNEVMKSYEHQLFIEGMNA